MIRPEAGPDPGPAPLPAGFSIVFDPRTQFVGADVLFGGSPPRLLRLNAAGQRALAELRRGPVCSAAAGKLARRLTDTGMAHPRPPSLARGGPPEAGSRRAGDSAGGPGGRPPGPASLARGGPPEAGSRRAGDSAGGPGGRPPGPALPDVTVVIPARDRAGHLDRCLAALGRSYPVVVVDDGSRQAGEIADLCRRHGATLIRRPRSGGPGPARNDGLAQVSTGLVAFVDSDCEAGPEWITSLAAHFADPLVAAVAPRVRPITGPGSAGRYLAARAPLDMGPQEGRVLPLTRLSYVPTAALLVRRSALAAAAPGAGLPGARSPPRVLISRVLIARMPFPRGRVPSTPACATARTWTSSGGSRKPAGGSATTPPRRSATRNLETGPGCWGEGSVMDVRQLRLRAGTRGRCLRWSCRPGQPWPSRRCSAAGRWPHSPPTGPGPAS